MGKSVLASKKTNGQNRRASRRLRDKTEAVLAVSRPNVRKEYARCLEEILSVRHSLDVPGAWCKSVISTSLYNGLTRTEITLVHYLLEQHGWDVRLATPLVKGSRGPILLIYYHPHRSRVSSA